MKFSFKIQQYQTDAVDAVARVFQGQPYNAGVSYLRDMGNLSAQPQQLSLVSSGDDAIQVELLDLINDSGFKNEALQLTDQELLQNIRALQAEAKHLSVGQVGGTAGPVFSGYRDGNRNGKDIRLHQDHV